LSAAEPIGKAVGAVLVTGTEKVLNLMGQRTQRNKIYVEEDRKVRVRGNQLFVGLPMDRVCDTPNPKNTYVPAYFKSSENTFEQKVIVSFGKTLCTVTSMVDLFNLVNRTMELESETSFGEATWKCRFSIELVRTGELLNAQFPLTKYNWQSGPNQLRITRYHAFGGNFDSLAQTPINWAVGIENFIISNPQFSLDEEVFDLQAEENTERQREAEQQFGRVIGPRIQKYLQSQDFKNFQEQHDAEWIACTIENIYHSFYWFKRTDSYYTWACLVYKLFTGKSSGIALMNKFEQIFGVNVDNEVQSGLTDSLKFLRSSYECVESIEENEVVKKFKKLYSYLLVQGFLSKFGMEVTDDEYSRLEQKALYASYSSKRGLWMSAFDVVLFLAEKADEFYETRDISVFSHTTSEYADWHKEVDRLTGLSDFIGNLEAHGTTYFTYIADLDAAIEKGDAYAKYTKLRGHVESTYMLKRLSTLRNIKLTQITRQAAQQERQAPFGVLVAGKSGVGKSLFTKAIYKYFGKLRGHDVSDRFIYRRNVQDQYWSNFDTSKWCIQLDDIAFKLPSKTTDLDDTLAELLNIANNVPYVPNQADLKDKGNTPVRSELLIGTSNAEHLNAHEYFYCPLAAQRRLPFIIVLEPKQEYRNEIGMLNAQKVRDEGTPNGVYPNYWNITVKQLKPYLDGDRERATVVEKHTYTDVNEFMRSYGESIVEHFKNQNSALECDEMMSDIEICHKCLYPRTHCVCTEVQAGEVIERQPHWRFPASRWNRLGCWCLSWYTTIFMWFLTAQWYMWVLSFVMRWRVGRNMTYKLALMAIPETAQIKVIATLNSVSTMPARWRALSQRTKLMIGIAGLALTVGGSYIMTKKTEKKEVKRQQEKVVETEIPHQGNKFNTTEEQLEKEESQNVWYTPTIETSRFDIPIASQSLVGKTVHEIRDLFARNVVHLNARTTNPDGTIRVRNTGGVFVSGGYLLTNAHLFEGVEDECGLEIISNLVSEGLNSNLTVRIKKSEIVFKKELDLCMMKITARPPEKNIMKFWMDKEFTITRAVEVRRTREGLVDAAEIFGISLLPETNVPSLGITIPAYIGTMDRETQNGDCGSLAIANMPLGVCIMGIHLLGKDARCGHIQIMKSTVEELQKAVDAMEFIPLDVEGGGEPMLSTSDRTVLVGQVGVRSMSRYIKKGTLRMYGSLNLPAPRYISRVKATPLQAEMLEHFNVKVENGKPVMYGWEPWHNNLIKMVDPKNTFDRPVMMKCAEQYVEDVISQLPEGWEKELVTLSDKAAINGLPGVKFIDGMNRNSSMGFPWNTTKKNYLVPAVDDLFPDGVDLTSEVWERVRKIEKCYDEGRRAYPVFSAHLKDCAIPFEKIQKKKTRIFTGQPVDHCIVMRKLLLPFVRLVQKNKFAFEAGPGTVTQSKEWGQIREYLTVFGDERIVGGDFGSYDKNMEATLIIIAFMMIAKIHQMAGFDATECRRIMCLGYDIAFSFCNFRGDLVEFFGTNPSGHALTVIINSLVNSLYMRYSYYMSNPEHEVLTFKQFVHLFTYGDDNVMGVSKKCDWFNHTAISQCLANIGVEYTMADKHSESVPFIHIDNVSFLKRKWRYDEEVQAWLCPLEMSSLHKTLTVGIPSKTIDENEQMVELILCVNNELFFHGRKEFEKHHDFFKSILDRSPFSCVVKAQTLMNFDELVERYQQKTVFKTVSSLDTSDLAVL